MPADGHARRRQWETCNVLHWLSDRPDTAGVVITNTDHLVTASWTASHCIHIVLVFTNNLTMHTTPSDKLTMTVKAKGMTHDQQNRQIFSAKKICLSHAKSDWFCRPIISSDVIIQHKTHSTLDDKTDQLLDVSTTFCLHYHGNSLQ